MNCVRKSLLFSILVSVCVSNSVLAFPFQRQERRWKFPKIEYGVCDQPWAAGQYSPRNRTITLCDRKMHPDYKRYVIQHEVQHFQQHRFGRPFSEREADFKTVEYLFNLGDCDAIAANARRPLSRVGSQYQFGVQYARQRLRECYRLHRR